MGLADRNYMRDEYHAPRMTTALIAVLIVAFVVQCVLLYYGDWDVMSQLALSVAGLRQGKIWQLVTFQFLHSYPWPFHVLFNCLGLYFFGRPVEEMLGGRRFLSLYFLSGIAGGLLQVATTAILPRHPDIEVVGASAGVCGMIAIFCTFHPMQELTTWIYFLPINIRARTFLIFLALFSIFGTIIPLGNIAHAAHLGGILVGLAYVRWGERLLGGLSGWPGFGRRREQELAQTATRRGRPWRQNTTKLERQAPAEDFMSKEVDPILEKISAHGIDALTERDRKILEAARKKMGRSGG